MKFSLASFLLATTVSAQGGSYPGELVWSSNTATLEFCDSGSGSYGYNKDSDTTSACDTFAPGPLIRMQPGTTYTLTLKNKSADSTLKTNVHTHGLHIVGSGDGDNVLRFVEGGSCLDYTWDIPADHPPGTYWYHPHYHTLTNAQTGGGAHGMIIIEDDQTKIPEWARRSNEKILMISDVPSGLVANGNANEGEIAMHMSRMYVHMLR